MANIAIKFAFVGCALCFISGLSWSDSWPAVMTLTDILDILDIYLYILDIY